MEKIEIGEQCFGPFVLIDGISIHEEFASDERESEIESIKKGIIEELNSLIPKMDVDDFRRLVEIIVRRGDYEYINGSNDDCDQCGNYNSSESYQKIVE